jgi:hypothetical protein
VVGKSSAERAYELIAISVFACVAFLSMSHGARATVEARWPCAVRIFAEKSVGCGGRPFARVSRRSRRTSRERFAQVESVIVAMAESLSPMALGDSLVMSFWSGGADFVSHCALCPSRISPHMLRPQQLNNSSHEGHDGIPTEVYAVY